MKTVASAGSVEIRVDRGWQHSFFASPYQAHRDFAAVDICQGKRFGDHALSPVEGKVTDVMKFDSPTPTGRSLPEYLILIKNGDYIARIMHVEPLVKKGDNVDAGDAIGRFISNGFFTFWVDAIMHVEVRRPGDFLRARGGYELEPAENTHPKALKIRKIKGTVLDTSPRNVSVKLNRKNVADVSGRPAILDGATSLDYGGVLGRFKAGEGVYYNGIRIGTVEKTGSYSSIYRTEPVGVLVNGEPYEGVSFGSCGSVKLLPKKYGEVNLKKGDTFDLEMIPVTCSGTGSSTCSP